MRHRFAVALVATNLLASLWAAASLTLAHAQGVPSLLDPLAPVRAYTTADPIDPDRLGLATPDGRFAIRAIAGGGCEGWLQAGRNVLIYPDATLPPWLAVSELDGTTGACIVHVEGRMDPTPCMTGDDGACDVAAEGDV
jgi:hypothetical protein